MFAIASVLLTILTVTSNLHVGYKVRSRENSSLFEGAEMITPRLRLAGLVALLGFAINCPVALAQSKITACGTTISAPGSYVVTANLTSASTSVPCIKVTAAPATIDLDGFVL